MTRSITHQCPVAVALDARLMDEDVLLGRGVVAGRFDKAVATFVGEPLDGPLHFRHDQGFGLV